MSKLTNIKVHNENHSYNKLKKYMKINRSVKKGNILYKSLN